MRVVDLFCGCGGLSQGFQEAGFEIVAAMDNDISDVSKTITIIKKYGPDMIIGGPPCQDFSSAGKRDESLGRANLTDSFSEIIIKYKPTWFVMENVERIKSSQTLTKVIKRFSKENYHLSAIILDASYCGVPQLRKRFFLIGQYDAEFSHIKSVYLKNMGKSPMTIRDYLGNSLNLQYYYRHPRNYSRRAIFSIDEPSPTVRGVNRPVPAGYKKHPGDPVDVELSQVRPLTTIERSYIQTFPKDFLFNGTKTNLEQMIGNAVPVKLAKFVADGIMEYVSSNTEIYNSNTDLFGNFPEFTIPSRPLHYFQ